MMNSFRLKTPEHYDFNLSLAFLRRSPRELLHRCSDGEVVKLIKVNQELILFRISVTHVNYLTVAVLNADLTEAIRSELKKYIIEWFDLSTDLKPFYSLAKKDKLLNPLVKKYKGYRIVGHPDLFESLVWAVIGQQINLQFAYTIKSRFVENFGEQIMHDNLMHYLFPTPDAVADLNDAHLLPLQFSRQKSLYTLKIAEAFVANEISKQKLASLSFEDAKEALMKIKGIGNWTANYALMKTFRYSDAFPAEDAGVHNALKNLRGMDRKPTLDEVKKIFKKYKGWEAYATLYLWKSL